MSQLPKYGGKGGKIATATTTRTSRIPGTGSTRTQSQTEVTEIAPCSRTPQENVRASQGAIPRTSGIRQPSGIARPGTCTSSVCSGGGPPSAKKQSGLPQVSMQGIPRSVQQPPARTPTGLQPPRPTGLQRPTPVGQIARPAAAAGPPGPSPSGMQRPTPSGIQRPAGIPRVTPSGIQKPSGLQRPTPPCQKPSGLRPPSSAGRRGPSPRTTPGVCPAPCGSAVMPAVTLQAASPQQPQQRPLPIQTPAKVYREMITPSAPARRTERPRGPEAYKQFMFESKYKLKKPTAPGLTPSPGSKKKGPSPEEKASRSLMERSMSNVGEKVTAKAATFSPAEPEFITTPTGMEKVIKQTIMEKRVERDEEGEKIVKNLRIIDAEKGKAPKMIEMNLQQMDPKFALPDGKEVISITSKVSVTATYATASKDITRARTETVPEAMDMPPQDIAKLVEEENEDVENTLKMLPPDMILSPGRYEMKKRLQNLQLNSESVALLEQSIIRPEARPDEAQNEPTPEGMAVIMHTVEKGVPPDSTPDQVFNSLFVETSNERYIKLCPVSQGPLQDVVVPTEIPVDVHKEVISEDMEKLAEKLQNIPTAAELPVLDIFDRIIAEEKKKPNLDKSKKIQFIADETSLWVNANMEHLINVVGATPIANTAALNIEDSIAQGNLEADMSAGMEFFVEADPIQYMSRVQLRGTQVPSYFPGYLIALPEFPDVVKLASSPDEVFASAWKSVQPKYFPDESMQSLIF